MEKDWAKERESYPVRYAVSYLIPDGKHKGMRTMLMPIQGRYTFATRAGAEAWLEGFMAGDTTLWRQQGIDVEQIKVSAIKCYPVHFDPVGCWIEEED